MKVIGVTLLSISTLFCFGIAGYLAIHGMSNWGWFLFVGVLLVIIFFIVDWKEYGCK